MNELQRINGPRVEKILKMLATIDTSAKSNKATDEELAELLAPIRDAVGGRDAQSTVVPQPKPRTERSHHSDLLHLARTEPLEHAVNAMSVIATRVEQELYERRTAG